MSETLSAVVAGSKGFVDAVQGHLKMRFGTPPLVARDPAEALRACADKGGLLVLEYAGSPWLEAVKNLRGACGDAALSIVAAVPLAQAADVRPLQRAGSFDCYKSRITGPGSDENNFSLNLFQTHLYPSPINLFLQVVG